MTIRGTVPLLVLLAVGCYKPDIQNGGFRCNQNGKACPDGFLCDAPTNTCRRTASDGGKDIASDTRDGGVDTITDGTSDRAEVACLPPVAGCTPQAASGCDPVCQTGCPCAEKCSANSAGVVGCHVPLANPRRQAGESCDISAAGSATQTDNCAPGLVCLADACGSRCYAFCRADGDCPGSTCTRDAGGGVKICDVPLTACNPVGTQAQTACPVSAQGCYVSAAKPDQTMCDCPFGAQGNGASCTFTRDCVPGMLCVDANNTSDLRCHPVCTIGLSCLGCPGASFRTLAGSTKYGYCF
jgi:hypothetical protein